MIESTMDIGDAPPQLQRLNGCQPHVNQIDAHSLSSDHDDDINAHALMTSDLHL
jgi:hypothetical protein